MDNIRDSLFYFSLVAILFLIIIFVVFRIFLKKFKFTNKNIEIYGLLLNLDTVSLLSIATTTVNYLFLVWWTISFQGLNIIFVAVTLLLVIISDALLDNFNKLWVSLLFTGVTCGAIQIIYLLFNYLTTEKFNFMLLLILFLVILFVFLYYTYNLLRNINNIVVKNKYLKNKKYKV